MAPKRASKTSDLKGAYSSLNEILVFPSFIYVTVSAETGNSRNDQKLLSQPGQFIPIASKGGPLGLGVGCEGSICYGNGIIGRHYDRL